MTCCARKFDILLHLFVGLTYMHRCLSFGRGINSTAKLLVDASMGSSRQIPDTLFGVFFEEINHAGAGGIWAELVSNRGFEAGGISTPSNIDPWSLIGEETLVVARTELSSCFQRNKVALRIDVLCDRSGPNICPPRGVGVYNPGFWGMSIEAGKSYKLVFYVRSLGSIDLVVSLANSNGSKVLATTRIRAASSDVLKWTRMETSLKPWETNSNSRLELTTVKGGTLWFDQVSLMPEDTHKGHGFRNDLFDMLVSLKPRFIRFPGGCFVEGEWLRNAFRWKSSIGPWEERPGHFGDVWMYWTDDGLGYFEFLQLAEDIGASPVWVINNGISHQDEVGSALISPFVQDALDSIQFAVGDPSTLWGSARAAMGRLEPFSLKHVAIGNEDCGKKNYRGNYLKFYSAIKGSYPEIKVISNCDASSQPLDHPADFYDFHVYTSATDLFSMYNQFDKTSRSGPKAFVSEYAVTGKDAGTGTLLAALAEGAFLIGLETNSDAVEMASYAPLFVNANDRRWNPDAIVFDSVNVYGTPSFWVQRLFTESSGAGLLKSELRTTSMFLVASAVRCKNSSDGTDSITLKIVNMANEFVDLDVIIRRVGLLTINATHSSKTVLTSSDPMDENSFRNPHRIVPVKYPLDDAGDDIRVKLDPFSVTCLHLLLESNHLSFVGGDAIYTPAL